MLQYDATVTNSLAIRKTDIFLAKAEGIIVTVMPLSSASPKKQISRSKNISWPWPRGAGGRRGGLQAYPLSTRVRVSESFLLQPVRYVLYSDQYRVHKWARLLKQQTSITVDRMLTKENKLPFSVNSVCRIYTYT